MMIPGNPARRLLLLIDMAPDGGFPGIPVGNGCKEHTSSLVGYVVYRHFIAQLTPALFATIPDGIPRNLRPEWSQKARD